MIKLVVLTGISQRVLAEILLSDINLNKRIITINHIEIYIPSNFFNQILVFLELRKSYTPFSRTLFIRHDDASIKGLMGSYLGYNFKDENMNKGSSVVSISKFVIIKMLQNNISYRYIKDLTGYQDSVIDPCQEYADIGREKEYTQKINLISQNIIS